MLSHRFSAVYVFLAVLLGLGGVGQASGQAQPIFPELKQLIDSKMPKPEETREVIENTGKLFNDVTGGYLQTVQKLAEKAERDNRRREIERMLIWMLPIGMLVLIVCGVILVKRYGIERW